MGSTPWEHCVSILTGLQKVGLGLGLNLPLPCCRWVRKGFATFIMMMNNTYSPALITLLLICVIWPEMQIGLFYNLDVAHSKNSLENEPNWACITKTVLTGKIAFVCQKWKLGNNCGMKFRQHLDFPPNISPTCPLQIHAQSPSSMHSSGLDLIGNY